MARCRPFCFKDATASNILLVPDLEAGNMMVKQLHAAGIVCGAREPIVLTARADNARARVVSATVPKLVAHERRRRLLPKA